MPSCRTLSPTPNLLVPEDIHLPVRSPGGPPLFPSHVENLLVDVIKYYIDACMSLTKSDLLHLFDHIPKVLAEEDITGVGLKNGFPSVQWVRGFFSRNAEVCTRSVVGLEGDRVRTTTSDFIREHLGCVKTVITRYIITDPRRFLNVDETGCSFNSMTTKSLRKTTGMKRKDKLMTEVAPARGSMHFMTIVTVLSAHGESFKPIIVLPGNKLHNSNTMMGTYKNLQDYLPYF